MLWYWIALPAAVLVYAVIFLIFGNSSERTVKKRLSRLTSEMELDNIHDIVMKEKRRKNNTSGRWNFISQKFEDDLVMSGIQLNAREYLTAWAGTTFLPILLTAALGLNFFTILGAGIIGFAIPPILVNRAKKKRQQLFNDQLGDSLIIMRNCLKSGYTFQQVLESVATEMQPPISLEFARVLREMRYGVKQEDALTHMVERVQNKDLSMLVSAVIISSQVGANLSEILENISSTIKDRIKIRNDVRILSAQGRTSGLIIGLLPVAIALLLMLINPTYITSFFQSSIGKIMIVAGIALEALGFFLISKIVDIKY